MEAKKSEGIEQTAPANWRKKNAPEELAYSHYCILDSTTGNCAQPATSSFWAASMSIVYEFYGDSLVDENGNWNCVALSETTVRAKADELVEAMDSESGQLTYGFYMKKDTQQKGYTSITRSALNVAGPICLSKDGASSKMNLHFDY